MTNTSHLPGDNQRTRVRSRVRLLATRVGCDIRVCRFDRLESRLLFSTFSTLTDLTGTNGHEPQSGLIMDAGGNLYGTSEVAGTSGMGNVFEVSAGTNTLSTVASFNGTDGSSPSGGLVMDAAGNMYGTANGGGADSFGTVYEIPAGANTPTTLDYFTGANGAFPYGNLILDGAGNLYGTTSGGGQDSDGTVFEVAASTHKITSLAFFNGADGAVPYAGLVMDSAGNLYGTTSASGANNCGTVFEVTAVSHSLTVLNSFTLAEGQTDVVAPEGALIIDSSGNLYGTAPGGGGSVGHGSANGFGDVYEVSAAAPHTISVLASFGINGNVGDAPLSGVIMDGSGNLFGTTLDGTAGPSTSGEPGSNGSIFEVPAGANTITTLYSFNDLGVEGTGPVGGLFIDASGNLYGTTSAGNFSAAGGTVFEVSGAATPLPVNLIGGALTVNGTVGNDTIALTSDGANLTAAVNGAAAAPIPLSFINSIDVEAGAGNDSVTLGSDVPASSVQGGPGDDTIYGGPGNDTLGGGLGNDLIFGDAGDDSIRGGAGNDSLGGGQGNDSILGSLGNDTITGGAGNDVLIGGAGNNVVHGGLGDDVIYAINGTADTLYGGAGNDTAHIDQGLDQIPSNDIETVFFS